MAARPLLALLSIIFLAGGIILQFLVALSGTVETSPENQIYLLQSSTYGIPHARNPTRWTFFSLCGVDSNNRNADCGAIVPALPFDPPNPDDFNTTIGIPPRFLGTKRYFYLSHSMYALFLIALFCAAFALVTSGLALCIRLCSSIAGLNTCLALLFQAAAAALMTAWTVQGRNAFRKAGQTADIGVTASVFTWLAVACYFVATIAYCKGGSVGRDKGDAADQQAEGFSGMESTRNDGGSSLGMSGDNCV